MHHFAPDAHESPGPGWGAASSGHGAERILRLALLRRPSRQRRRQGSQGFTLIELMIVVSVLGILVVLAIPRYQQARSAALMGSVVGELISYAKACAILNATGIGQKPTPPALSPVRGGVVIQAGCTGESVGATLEASWGAARAVGVPCYSERSRITSTKAKIEVTPESVINCTFQD